VCGSGSSALMTLSWSAASIFPAAKPTCEHKEAHAFATQWNTFSTGCHGTIHTL
jgi:hypothetical protein